MLSIKYYRYIGLFFLLSVAYPLYAANSQFISIEKILASKKIDQVQPYSIVLESYPLPINKDMTQQFKQLNSNLIVLLKVNVKKVNYIRLVAGNYNSLNQAKTALKQYKKLFKGAWINKRKTIEKEALTKFLLNQSTLQANTKRKPSKALNHLKNQTFVKSLIEKMQQQLINKNYPRAIASANKIIELGNRNQQQQAMEILGIVRERQGKFSLALSIYSEFLTLYPKSSLSKKVKARILSLKTMRQEPKKKQSKFIARRKNKAWRTFGSLSQSYRDDTIQQTNSDSEQLNSSLISDINVFSRKRDSDKTQVIRFDGSYLKDFLNNDDRFRISRALFSYSNTKKEYKIISGRQSRTAKGVLGRFDGAVFTSQAPLNYNYSLYVGSPVQSSYDSYNGDALFAGGSINFEPYPNLITDIYFMSQQRFGLVDRQAIGSEAQYIVDNGFIFALIDYDIFYHDLNNLTLISNYRYSDTITINATLGHRNSPFLTTLNALQGQSVETLKDLKKSFSKTEIYQLAKDRTSKSTDLYLSSNFILDENRQLNLSLSFAQTEATTASATILATPASNSIYLSSDYTIKNYFGLNDYTSMGVRLSKTSTSKTISLRSRTRLRSKNSVYYSPRLNLDYRINTQSDFTQWVLKPSIKIQYKLNKKISFDGNISIEYSDLNLPDSDKQTAYSLYIGYVYQF